MKFGTYFNPRDIRLSDEGERLISPISKIFDLDLVIVKYVFRLRRVLVKDFLDFFNRSIITR